MGRPSPPRISESQDLSNARLNDLTSIQRGSDCHRGHHRRSYLRCCYHTNLVSLPFIRVIFEPVQTTMFRQTLTSTTSTSADLGQGPVGQPAPTGAATPTVYTYTTTNANGQTVGVVDTFTPTFYQSQQSPTLLTGTILNYSSWLSMVGTNTAVSSPQQVNGANIKYMSGGSCGMLLAFLSSVVGGTWLVLLWWWTRVFYWTISDTYYCFTFSVTTHFNRDFYVYWFGWSN